MATSDIDNPKSQTATVSGKGRARQADCKAILEELNKLRAEISRTAKGSIVETLVEMRRERDLMLRGLWGRAPSTTPDQEQIQRAPPCLVGRTPDQELALLPPPELEA